MTKDPITFLLQFIAWLMLIAVLSATWAGVKYPNGRTKPYIDTFTKVHPRCLNRLFIDIRYEGEINLELCHTEFRNEPIEVSEVESLLGNSSLLEVSTTRIDTKGQPWTTIYRMQNREQTGPFLITLFHKFPDGVVLSSIGGVSYDPASKQLKAHFMNGGNDRCHGGQIEILGMVERNVIAISQATTPFGLINPVGKLIEEKEKTVHATFPDWKPDEAVSNSPERCVGRLIGTFEPMTEKAELTAIAVNFNALLLSATSQLEACISDAIVRADIDPAANDGDFSIFSPESWNEVLYQVHMRCGSDHAFHPINSGI